MEKQKIFWVVLSVSVFVVVVLIVGVYLLRQKPQAVTSAPGTVNPISDQGTQVYEYSQSQPQAQTQPGTGEQKPGETQTMHFYIGEGDKGQQPAQKPQAVEKPPAPVAQPQAQVSPQQPPAASPRTVAAVPRKASRPVKTAVKARPPVRHAVDFWIQTGSYKSQSKAEELVALLADKGLSGRVFSYDTRGATYYRVRIGPYGNSGEADKFLSIVKQIQGLESSFVSQVGGAKNLN